MTHFSQRYPKAISLDEEEEAATENPETQIAEEDASALVSQSQEEDPGTAETMEKEGATDSLGHAEEESVKSDDNQIEDLAKGEEKE